MTAMPVPVHPGNKTSDLKQCFINMTCYKKVTLELRTVQRILSSQFKVDLNSLDPLLAKILPEFLVYRMRNWSGFQDPKCPERKLSFDARYEAFVHFLSARIHQVIHKDFMEVMAETQNQPDKVCLQKNVVDKATGTDTFTLKPNAPFSINITGEPIILNSIAFTLGSNNTDVLLRQHYSATWLHADLQTMSIKQVLSWPYVGVHMVSPILSIARKNMHDVRRYVSLKPGVLSRDACKFIERTKIINQYRESSYYDIDYIKRVFFGFLNTLECLDTVPVIQTNFDAYKALMEEFLSDIKELNILKNEKPIIDSNTAILFNIGKNAYFRTKKLRKLDQASLPLIGYTEVIVPKMEIAIEHLAYKSQINTYLGRLSRFDTIGVETRPILPSITFSCLFCHVDFCKFQDVVKHFTERHKMEPPMVCVGCKKIVNAFELSKNRWGHECCGPAKPKEILLIN